MNIDDLMIEHGKLLQTVLEDIQTNGIVMDSKQMRLLGTLSRSKAFIQGYREGYKDAQEELKHKS